MSTHSARGNHIGHERGAFGLSKVSLVRFLKEFHHHRRLDCPRRNNQLSRKIERNGATAQDHRREYWPHESLQGLHPSVITFFARHLHFLVEFGDVPLNYSGFVLFERMLHDHAGPTRPEATAQPFPKNVFSADLRRGLAEAAESLSHEVGGSL